MPTVPTFKCPVVTVSAVEHHPNADRLDVAKIGGYEVVVGRDQWAVGDKAVYLPEASVLPDSLVSELGLEGRLAGKSKNRVKAAKLRGIVSQGLLVHPNSPHLKSADRLEEGDDLASVLGIVKWEPPIPISMQGKLEACTWPSSFDVESWQRPDAPQFDPGEPIQVTEKLHGTFCLLGWHREFGATVASKGQLGKSRFKLSAEDNSGNLYCKAWQEHGESIEDWAATQRITQVELLGEIAGRGVQDLTYGVTTPSFFGFGIRIDKETVAPQEARRIFTEIGATSVPVLGDEMSFDHENLVRLASEPSALKLVSPAEKDSHRYLGLREGLVVQSLQEPSKRVKYVNPDYLTRRGGTEYN